MINKELHFKKTTNWLKLLSISSLLALGVSCSEEQDFEVLSNNDASSILSAKLNTTFQAEDYDAQSGVQVVSGSKVGYIQNGDWIKFDDFDHSGATSITVRAASSSSGGTIQFRKGSATGGNLLAEVNVSGTGGWNNFQEFSANITGSSSNSDLYVVFTGGSGYLLDIDSFEFTSDDSETPTTTGGRFEEMVGKTVRIENTNTNDWLRITSNASLVDCEMVNQNNTGNWPRWVVEEVNDGGNYYYRFKNVTSNRRFRPETTGNNQNIYVGETSWTGNWTQWEITSNGNGEYVFKNKVTDTYLSAASATDGTIAKSVTSENNFTTWRIEDLDGNDANGNGDNGNNGGTTDSNSDFPGEAIGLTTQNWKLNGFSGSGSGATYEDDLLDALGLDFTNYSSDTYFYEEDGFAWFKCYRGLGGSSNSSNPRVELRELLNGSDSYVWDGDDGEHIMEWTVRVDQLPQDADGTGGVLCFGQIHGPSEAQGFNDDGVDVDDTIRVQFIGDENQSTGGVRLKISGYITEEQGGSVTLDNGYQLDTEYVFRITMDEGTIYVHVDGEEVFKRQLATSGDTSYFKVGNYLQSVQGASYTGSYGLVGIKNLSVTHPNSSHNK